MLKKHFFLVVCFSVISLGLFGQNSNDSQNSEKQSTVIEIAKEAWGLYVQYKRITSEVKNYWENEIETGLKEGRYINNRMNSQYQKIKNIFARLLKSNHLRRNVNKYNWRIYLQNTDSLNAFAAIDGIIIINRGIVNFCQNDDELAVIIGHEIAHMIEDHIKKQLGTKVVKEPIIEHISSYIAQRKNKRLNTEEISDNEISDKEMFQLIFGIAGELALLKYSRSQEEKADEEGAKFAASVGYDTDKGYDLWSRMALNSNDRWLNFLSTPPNSQHRAREFLNSNYKRKYYKAYTGE